MESFQNESKVFRKATKVLKYAESENKIFSNETENIVSLLEKQNFLVWEVNIWLLIYKKNPELFDWYYGDHNLTMLKNF